MWFTSIFLKTLRDARIAILGWGAGLGLLLLAVLSVFPSLVETPEARASLVSLAGSFSWMAEPIAVDTPGGYATYKYGFTILILAIWPLLLGSRLLRGEEDRGGLDALLSLPRGRARVALEKLAALWTALLAMGLIIGLLAWVGGALAKAPLSLGDTLLFGLNLALIAGVFGALSLLISQFTRERGAASGVAGGLLLLSIMVDMVHRVFPGTEWISRLSPVYYYNLSRPMIPGYGADPIALLVLLALNVLLGGAAVALFVRRDIGGTAPLPGLLRRPARPEPAARPEAALPVNAWSLRSVYARGLRTIAVPAFWWAVAIAGFAGWMIIVAKQTEVQLASFASGSPMIKDFIDKVGGGGDSTMNAALVSALYTLLPVLLMAFAVTQANRWSADEEDGLQELVLSTPQSRLKVLLARFGAVTTATVVIGVLTLAVAALAAAGSGLRLDGGNLAAATLSIIPLGLLMAALGYLFSGWLRAAVDTGLLSFLLVIWFFLSFVGPELNLPDAALRLSALYYYGTPLLHGLPLGYTLTVLAVAGGALALASMRFMRKDLGR
jgi:ABC-2 type transport system permease protein